MVVEASVRSIFTMSQFKMVLDGCVSLKESVFLWLPLPPSSSYTHQTHILVLLRSAFYFINDLLLWYSIFLSVRGWNVLCNTDALSRVFCFIWNDVLFHSCPFLLHCNFWSIWFSPIESIPESMFMHVPSDPLQSVFFPVHGGPLWCLIRSSISSLVRYFSE